MGRLRDRLFGLLDALCVPRHRERESAACAVRGNMRNVLVVKPDSDVFREAIFILRDDYFQAPGVTRQELLRQARAAVREYMDAYVPPRRRGLMLPVISALAGISLLVALGVMLFG